MKLSFTVKPFRMFGYVTPVRLFACVIALLLVVLGFVGLYRNEINVTEQQLEKPKLQAITTLAINNQEQRDDGDALPASCAATGTWRATNSSTTQYYTNRYKRECTTRSRSVDSWEWIPSQRNCFLKEFSPRQFCKVMEGPNVVVLGDSISGHFFREIHFALNESPEPGKPAVDSTITPYPHPDHIIEKQKKNMGGIVLTTLLKTGQFFMACDGRVKVTNIATSRLTYGSAAATIPELRWDDENFFLRNELWHNVSVVIFNVGAHIWGYPPTVVQNLAHAIVVHLKERFGPISPTGNQPIMFFRTTPIGHMGCHWNGTLPSSSCKNPEIPGEVQTKCLSWMKKNGISPAGHAALRNTAHVTEYLNNCNWYGSSQFRVNDMLMKPIFREAGFKILDVYMLDSMMLQGHFGMKMSDGICDCLHRFEACDSVTMSIWLRLLVSQIDELQREKL